MHAVYPVFAISVMFVLSVLYMLFVMFVLCLYAAVMVDMHILQHAPSLTTTCPTLHHTAFPTPHPRSMLRNHPPPNQKKLQEVKAALEHHGHELNISSAGAIQQSMVNMCKKLPPSLMDSVSQLLLRTMEVCA